MAKTFGAAERYILSLFSKGTSFEYRGETFTTVVSDKPTCSSGEPKTDIYIEAINSQNKLSEFKISFKKKNADFLENKINKTRAKQLFGNNWQHVITTATATLKDAFLSRELIFKETSGKSNKGSITLGWKFELLNVKSGNLSNNMLLSRKQIIDVYAGTNLSVDKRNATVDNRTIINSGVANFILFEDEAIKTAQDAINALISIEDYATQHPDIYFACKALNYRTFKEKYDGNRPLAVYIDWFVTNGKLDYTIIFDDPLTHGGDYVATKLKEALKMLHVKNTDDLNDELVMDPSKLHG